MFLLLASCAALSFALGTYLTKGVTLRISIFTAIGPLFLLNGMFAIPLIGTGPDWKLTSGTTPYLHVIAAFATAVVTYILFLMVSRSTASVSSVAQAMAPAVVLLLSPIFLSTSISLLQILLVIFLMGATLYPIRNSISGINSITTLLFMLVAALGNAVVNVIAKLLANQGVGMPETFIVRQLLAGIAFLILFPPRGLKGRDFFDLIRRSFFMAIGWMTSILARTMRMSAYSSSRIC